GYNRNNRQDNRNDRQDNYNNGFKAIPHPLCKHFRLRSDERGLWTLKREFEMAYEVSGLRETKKPNYFMMHLEGAIKTHAFSWKESRGPNNPMTYGDLINELQPSFQHSISAEIAERQLVGRKWNVFTPIDEFVHETRELVQSALPGLIGQWQNRIKSCVTQALPHAWDEIMSSSNKNCNEIVEWVRAQTMKIKNSPQEEWADWVKEAHRQFQSGAKAGSGSTQRSNNTNQQQSAKCYWCSGNHSSHLCGWKQQKEANNSSNQRQNNAPQNFSNAQSNSNWRPPNMGNYQQNGGQSNRGNYNRGGYNNQPNGQNSGQSNFVPRGMMNN
ncbi:MAG: hypothetical protein GY820_20730, partial [Gammaproteobacteria bacterium]|nr:hypothetical protein [Gammaproteobacteria bacterium]